MVGFKGECFYGRGDVSKLLLWKACFERDHLKKLLWVGQPVPYLREEQPFSTSSYEDDAVNTRYELIDKI